MGEQKYCTNCGTVAAPKVRNRGSMVILLFCFICLLIPGIFYLLYMVTGRVYSCPNCKALNPIPLNSPAAKRAMIGSAAPVPPPIAPSTHRSAAPASGFEPGLSAAHAAARDAIDDDGDMVSLVSHAWGKQNSDRAVGPNCDACGLDMGMVMKARGTIDECPSAGDAAYDTRSDFYDFGEMVQQRGAAVRILFHPQHFALRVALPGAGAKVHDAQSYPLTNEKLTALCKATAGW